MSSTRNADDLMAKMAHNQAHLFQQASSDDLPSYSFIKMFLCSRQTEELDKLILVSDDEIYVPIKARIKKRGVVLPENTMHWIGYMYRCLSYLYDVSSRSLLRLVPPKYLVSVYPSYHALDPRKAAARIKEERFKDGQSNLERTLSLMKKLYL